MSGMAPRRISDTQLYAIDRTVLNGQKLFGGRPTVADWKSWTRQLVQDAKYFRERETIWISSGNGLDQVIDEQMCEIEQLRTLLAKEPAR